MADYSEEIAEALQEIQENGEAVRYRSVVNPRNDTPWIDVTAVYRDYDVWMAFFPIGQQSKYRSGTTTGRGGVTGLLGAYEFIPSLKDWVFRGNEQLAVRDIIEYKINEQPILYQIALDR